MFSLKTGRIPARKFSNNKVLLVLITIEIKGIESDNIN